MKKRVLSLTMALCLSLSLAIPAVAADTSSSATTPDFPALTLEVLETFGPDNPLHPYSIPSRWVSGAGKTHQFITGNAITIVRNAYPSYPLGSYTNVIKSFSDYPDNPASGQTDDGIFYGHFYNPSTGLTFTDEIAIRPKTDPTAKDRLVWWYNSAVSKYKAGNTSKAMEALGCALHYAADLSTPHHAANRIAGFSYHLEFENHAAGNQNKHIVTTTSSDTFTWAKRTSIGDMGHNFAVNAKEQIYKADNLKTFAEALSVTLPKAQRNCAAVIYKFLVDVGRF